MARNGTGQVHGASPLRAEAVFASAAEADQGEPLVSSATALASSPAVDEMDSPVQPMFDTIDDPAVLAARYKFTGSADLQFEVQGWPPGFLDKWHPYWAMDDGHQVEHCINSLAYWWVTKDECPEIYVTNKGFLPGNASGDNRICRVAATGERFYLLKTPKALKDKRDLEAMLKSKRRMDFISQRQVPGGMEFAQQGPNGQYGGAYSPDMGPGAFKLETTIEE